MKVKPLLGVFSILFLLSCKKKDPACCWICHISPEVKSNMIYPIDTVCNQTSEWITQYANVHLHEYICEKK